MNDWHVSADDRTGALEVAAEIAGAWGAPVRVTVHPVVRAGAVVDLASRRCAAAEAAARAAAVGRQQCAFMAHKIDSTLRGNWAAELCALHEVSGRRVLLLAAWPLMGRTCVDGVVHVHGSPVGDLRDHLAAVCVLHSTQELQHWLDDGAATPFAACDVTDTAGMLEAAALVGRHEQVLVAGPAGPIGAAFAARLGRPAVNVRCRVQLPAIVVCGSATTVAAAQVAQLRRHRPDVEVLTAPVHDGGDLDPTVAQTLADRGRQRARELGARTVVLVGGDTAAAFLGDAERSVGGTVLPGLPWSVGDETGVVVITKAGAFGDDSTLVRIFEETAG